MEADDLAVVELLWGWSFGLPFGLLFGVLGLGGLLGVDKVVQVQAQQVVRNLGQQAAVCSRRLQQFLARRALA